MGKRYQIITIYEEDHGCEGIPEGEEPMDQVLLRAEDGTEHWVQMPDTLLLQKNWNENDWIHWDMEEKETVNWSDAYNATPKFYRKPDGNPFGAIALTEDTETILPKNPQLGYRIDGKVVSDWNLVLVSISKHAVIGETNYFSALRKAEKYVLDTNKNSILIRGLSLAELESLIR